MVGVGDPVSCETGSLCFPVIGVKGAGPGQERGGLEWKQRCAKSGRLLRSVIRS